MTVAVNAPTPFIPAIDGTPLQDGYVYIGTANANPETSPISVYWDAALSIPASQPVRTSAGLLIRSGAPGNLYAATHYSITVRDKNSALVYTFPDSNEFSLSGVGADAISADDGSSGSIFTTIQGFINKILSSAGSSIVGFLQAGTGATTRTVQDKARDWISVRDFGATGDGTTNENSAFNAAAAAADFLYVPAGTYLVTSQVTSSATWFIGAGASITGHATVGANSLPSTAYLTGRVIHNMSFASGTGFRVGDPDPWLEAARDYTESIAEVVCLSSTGQIGLVAGTRTVDDPTANYAGIGLAAYGINSNTTNPEPAWAAYLETRSTSGTGAIYDVEADMVNLNTTFDMDPYTSIGSDARAVNLWLTNGGGDAGLGGNTNTAAIALVPNPAKFLRGIVVRADALDTSLHEALSLPKDGRVAWYGPTWLNSYIDGEVQRHERASDTTTDSFTQYFLKKKADRTTATADQDTVWRAYHFGWDGSANYLGGTVQVLQRGAFSGGNCRYSYDITTHNAAGTDRQITLQGIADNVFCPYPDNVLSLGYISSRWTVVYASTGSINTSDAREKTPVTSLSGREISAASALARAIGTFKFLEAMSDKGASARLHVGLTVQTAIRIMKEYELNPFAYGFICYDKWDDVMENGEVKVRAGDRYSFRPDELLLFIARGFEARLTRLEEKIQ